ncbi:MAG: ABC-2 transporter permease [Thermomicrobiales bacterium]
MSGFTRSLISLLPVSTLTLLHFSSGKAIRFVAFFAALPMIFGVIYQVGDVTDTPFVFMSGVMLGIVFGTLVPIATLILATSAFRDEIDDRTMVYLVIKPISRFRIVAEKYLAVTESTVLALWFGVIGTWILISASDLPDTVEVLVAALIAVLIGVAAYGAVFVAVSLIVPRALIVGIFYALIWESLLSRFIPGVWTLSIRHYVESIFVRLVNDPDVTLDNAVHLYAAFPALAVAIVVSLALSALRLRTMDFE